METSFGYKWQQDHLVIINSGIIIAFGEFNLTWNTKSMLPGSLKLSPTILQSQLLNVNYLSIFHGQIQCHSETWQLEIFDGNYLNVVLAFNSYYHWCIRNASDTYKRIYQTRKWVSPYVIDHIGIHNSMVNGKLNFLRHFSILLMLLDRIIHGQHNIHLTQNSGTLV